MDAVLRALPGPEVKDAKQLSFTISPFDFPMIDNTRLSDDQRCAVVLTAFDATSANIRVIYFPGSHASLRDRPYYEEIVEGLKR